MSEFLESRFHLKELKTTWQREVIAGLVIFLSMSYILAVNPNILGTVMNTGGVFAATAIASAVACFVMGFVANYPIALSAGMGLNAYFAFSVCLGDLQGDPNGFKVALTAVLIEGIVFIVISAFKFREKIINGIPQNLKFGISAGIGLFIALIGFVNAGIVVNSDSTLVDLGSFKSAPVVLAIVGFIIILTFTHYKVPGGILLGILITWILTMFAQSSGWYVEGNVYPDFSQGIGYSLSGLSETAFKFDFGWAASHIIKFLAITFSFLFVDLFDTVGTVIGVADKANLLDEEGKLPRVGKVFMADAVGTTIGACLGTSTITSFVESSTGVAGEKGGRTGLTAVVVGFLFIVSLLLSPIFLAIPSCATAPALVYVGMLMISSAKKINFESDIADTAGAFLAISIMPLTYSIANGIMFALVFWVILKLIEKKASDVSGIMWFIFALFCLRILSLVVTI